jgi:hypothetical protein
LPSSNDVAGVPISAAAVAAAVVVVVAVDPVTVLAVLLAKAILFLFVVVVVVVDKEKDCTKKRRCKLGECDPQRMADARKQTTILFTVTVTAVEVVVVMRENAE